MDWSPDTYRSFADQRQEPAVDLIARLGAIDPRYIVDLGCGAGAATDLLRKRWADARIDGIDNSAAMLEAAQTANVRWQAADIAGWRPTAAPDLIFSNAALHWLDNHRQLMPRLAAFLAPGGVLAIQMPDNFDGAEHRAARAAMADGPWAPLMAQQLRHNPLAAADDYRRILAPCCGALAIWRQVYRHLMPSLDDVVRWMAGAALAPALAGLGDGEKKAFLSVFRAHLESRLGADKNGAFPMPYRRLFIIAGAAK